MEFFSRKGPKSADSDASGKFDGSGRKVGLGHACIVDSSGKEMKIEEEL